MIGCFLNKPSLLDDDGPYSLREFDFDNDFHRVVYGTISNLYTMGAEHITTRAVEDYLIKREKSYGIYKANNGAEWLHKAFISADVLNFDYYYSRLKKMTLLRSYNEIGLNVDWIYDPDNILDFEKKEEQDKRLDETTLDELADEIDNRILKVHEMVVDNDVDESCQMGEGLDELMESLKITPAIGYPLYDTVSSRIAMGARLGKFYLRSAGTGVGKSRSMMADACTLACDSKFDNGKLISLGVQIPTVFISVELDREELQTMALAFIADVSEDLILEPGRLSFEEAERVKQAIEILHRSDLYMEYLPDYSLKDIENCIKRNIRVNKTSCVVLDYITSSMRMIEEISRASSGMKVREDQILFLLSSRLKDIAGKFNVFVLSGTQINGMAKDAKYLDQNMLSGAKAIANRIDYGEIMVDCSPQDLEDIEPLLAANPSLPQPNIKKSIYKNRRGKVNRVICWMLADKGKCRYETLFVTNFNYEFLSPDDLGIEV